MNRSNIWITVKTVAIRNLFLTACLLAIYSFSGQAIAQGIYLVNSSHPTVLYEVDLPTLEATFIRALTSDNRIHSLAACSGEKRLLTVGYTNYNVASIDLSTTPVTESVLGALSIPLKVLQMACSPDGRVFATDVAKNNLYLIDPTACDGTTCVPELLGVVSDGGVTVNLAGADMEFTAGGELIILTNQEGSRLYNVDSTCPGGICEATDIGHVATGSNNTGLAALPDGRFIISGNDDIIYEVDITDASVVALGFLNDGPNIVDIRQGDLTALVPCPPTIDFETNLSGVRLATGEIIGVSTFAASGIIASTNNPGAHPLMIFNSAAPSGNDPDLGTPNSDFGGPGVGSGGKADKWGRNGLPKGKVLIISSDGDSTDPNDYGSGGNIYFDFAPEAARVTEVHLLDIDEAGGYIKAYDADGNTLVTRPIFNMGNNSFQVVPIGASNVASLEIKLNGSGAVSALVFCGACGTNY